ncbi:MAG: ABC transporter substrate-binding protein [Thiolinea sp.]
MKRFSLKRLALSLTLAAGLAGNAHAQGVTDDEVIIGSNQDMSGVFAAFGAPAIAAANLYFDKVNADGGVHGRKIKLVVEDHAYQMPKAMQGLNKLVNSDKIFAMFLQLGTPMNMAAFPLMEKKQIHNVFALTGARQMIDPLTDYKWAGFSSYYDQINYGLKWLAENKGAKNICAMYIPSDFGLETQESAKATVEELKLKYAGETTHKPDEQDFVGSLTKLKGEGCDTIAIALSVRQAITVVATAKKMGWEDVNFLGASASFHTAVAKVPGGITNGFYAAASWLDLDGRQDVPEVAAWLKELEAAGEKPSSGGLLGRHAAEVMVKALEAAGKELTPESFKKGLESVSYDDALLGVKVNYGEDHQGVDDVILSQIVDGQWVRIDE